MPIYPPHNYYCLVCGLKQPVYPWGEHGDTPSYTICACCGLEFGTYDRFAENLSQLRQQWLAQGTPWLHPEQKPPNWDPSGQLKQIPQSVRDMEADLNTLDDPIEP